MSNVSIDRLSGVISTNLNTYSRTIVDGIEKAAEKTVDEMVARTKQRPTTKLSRGKYARSIASEVGLNTISARSRIWYVKKPRYRLAHLLNNGHAVRGGGRVSGDQHVTKATEKAITDFETRVREVVENASN
ncbi:MAG: hypothetical protein IIW43_01690 [Selenomonadales bacterium]|nr:hypothetical protein [Selenomonadales bacterium]